MPDSFFASKTRKRKRPEASTSTKPHLKKFGQQKPTKKRQPRDEELSDETQSDGGIDDLDLQRRPEDDEPVLSDEEDENETPAQKRLRLAKIYLEGLKEDLGMAFAAC